MQAIKIIATAIFLVAFSSAFADSICEQKAKTRDDFLTCTDVDTDKTISKAKKLYESIRQNTKGEKQVALDANFQIWKDKFKSDCSVVAFAFNEWGDGYMPDTDFQVAACRSKIASQELDFYKWLACPDDMETSSVPKCAAIKKILGENK
ncbi:hypothetical protein ACAX43_16525 [Paraburkholderia sp. IW21]|uniref:hypothetical protein n=1 Tax=Paraburkholderia sp. IW21 TaxID=3242488 RepID=UPI0035205682